MNFSELTYQISIKMVIGLFLNLSQGESFNIF